MLQQYGVRLSPCETALRDEESTEQRDLLQLIMANQAPIVTAGAMTAVVVVSPLNSTGANANTSVPKAVS